MNKKILIGIIAVVVIAIIIGGICLTKKENKPDVKKENLEEVTISTEVDYNNEKISATIGYPKDAGITAKDGFGEYEKVFKNEEKNWELTLAIQADTTYDDNKEGASEEEGYKTLTYNGYNGYIYNYSEDEITGAILLGDGAEDNVYKYVTIEFSPIDSYVDDKDVDVNPLYELQEVQNILNSIKFSGFTGKTKEEEDDSDKVKNYGKFESRTDGLSDKNGEIFIKSFVSPDEAKYKAEQRNDNIGIDNYLWYTSDKSSYNSSGIEVRIIPESKTYENIDAYKEYKGDMYHWSKQTIAGKEYDTYTFASETKPAKYSKYYSGAFMVGNRVITFHYNMYEEVPDQDLGDKFFKQIMDSIEYSEDFNK